MPNWAKTIDWLAINTSALLLAIVLWAISILSAPTQHEYTNYEPYSSPQQNIDVRTPEERLADYTLWLERFSGFLALVAAFQVWLLVRAEGTAKDTAIAARDNAQAALNSGRAHMWMKNIKFTFERNAQNVITGHKVTYEIWNGGPTPGIAKRIYIEMFEEPAPQWPLAPTYQPGGIMEHSGLVGPNSGHKREGLTFSCGSDDAQLAAFTSGTKMLVFWGYVTYVDVFDQTKEHESGYAFSLMFDANGAQPTGCSFHGPDAYWHYS